MTAKYKVLVLADINNRIEKEFPTLEFVYKGYALNDRIPLSKKEIMDIIPEYDFLVSEFDTIDSEIIDRAKRLKMIICCRGGVNTVIDLKYAVKKGIIVKNTPGRNSDAVVEYVLGVIFNADRKLWLANEMVLSDTLQKQQFILPKKYKDSLWGMDKNSPYHVFRGKGLSGITLGVIGYGNVGKSVVKKAVLLGMNVLVCNHHSIVSNIPKGVSVCEMDELLAKSDFVSLHCNNRNHRTIIGMDELKKMKRQSYFINTARGDLVDEDALIEALNSGIISGAILDVTKNEPLQPNNPLIRAKNIFITPHIAGAADEVCERGTDMAIYYLREYLNDYDCEDM